MTSCCGTLSSSAGNGPSSLRQPWAGGEDEGIGGKSLVADVDVGTVDPCEADADEAALLDEGARGGIDAPSRQQNAALRLEQPPGQAACRQLRPAFGHRVGRQSLDRDGMTLERLGRSSLEPVVTPREPEDAGPHEQARIELQPLLEGSALPRRVMVVDPVG